MDENLPAGRFLVVDFDPSYTDAWDGVVAGTLAAWKITAKRTFFQATTPPGWSSTVLPSLLNDYGVSKLPQTPTPSSLDPITLKTPITDITEVLAMEAVSVVEAPIVFPVPRVLHKELGNQQHKGIDLIGLRVDPARNSLELFIVEVKATIEQKSPPTVAYALRGQLLDTLNEPGLDRLIADLAFVHAEAPEAFKDVIDGIMADLSCESFTPANTIHAIAVLVRELVGWQLSDREPFATEKVAFGSAQLPAKLTFLSLRSLLPFCELMDAIKSAVTPPPEVV